MKILKQNKKKINHKYNFKYPTTITNYYGITYKIQIYMNISNTIPFHPFHNLIIFNVCEKTTIQNLLKFCKNISFPKERKNNNHRLNILWKTENKIGFDTFWSENFNSNMTLECLDFYYDHLYTKHNFLFLHIL